MRIPDKNILLKLQLEETFLFSQACTFLGFHDLFYFSGSFYVILLSHGSFMPFLLFQFLLDLSNFSRLFVGLP